MSIVRAVMKWLFGVLFVVVGVNHFFNADFYLGIMPPYLPWPLLLVYVSGIAEAALGVLFLVPRFQRAAAWGLVALLIAVFPANLHMAMNPELFPEYQPAILWARLPLQALLIAWAYWFTRESNAPALSHLP